MEVIGISNTSERCSAEGRITVLVRDSTGKLLNLDLGIGYSSRLVPKSIISVAQLMTKGSIFHFERGNCYLRTPTNQRISITERNGHFYIPLKELQSGDAKTDEDESAQGSNEQQPFLGFVGTVETDEDTLQYQRKTITTYRARGALRTNSIKHTVISTESHEKVAEAHFDTDEAFQEALAKAELAADSLPVGERKRFSEEIAECDDPVPMMQFVEDKNYSKLFSQQHGLRLMCTSSACNFVNIDYSLQPEPDYYQSLQKNGCREHFQWQEAREEEVKSMEKFKVWRRVKRSEAKGHKLLTCKWVHKRKTNERGEVNRFKARLVARGFTQVEYDSFHPDEVFAHVVDRNSLRTVLSMAASQDLKLYLCYTR